MASETQLDVDQTPFVYTALLDLVATGALFTHVSPNQSEDFMASSHIVKFVVRAGDIVTKDPGVLVGTMVVVGVVVVVVVGVAVVVVVGVAVVVVVVGVLVVETGLYGNEGVCVVVFVDLLGALVVVLDDVDDLLKFNHDGLNMTIITITNNAAMTATPIPVVSDDCSVFLFFLLLG